MDKFVGYTVTLPDSVANPSGDTASASAFHFRANSLASATLTGTMLQLTDRSAFVEDLIKLNHLSLRKVETLLKHYEVFQLIDDGVGLAIQNNFLSDALTLFGIFLYAFHSKVVIGKNEHIIDLGQALTVSRLLPPPNLTTGYNPTKPEIFSVVIVLFCNIVIPSSKITNNALGSQWRDYTSQLQRDFALIPRAIEKKILRPVRILQLQTVVDF